MMQHALTFSMENQQLISMYTMYDCFRSLFKLNTLKIYKLQELNDKIEKKTPSYIVFPLKGHFQTNNGFVDGI